ncbi:MAG: hypothetical protein PVH45_04815, partial [Candidatus Omnitrophota bacterium]
MAKKELLQILMGHEKDVIGIAELPDGRIVTAGKDRKIKIWNLKTKSVSEIQPPKGRNIPISSFAVLPDGRIVAGSEDGSVSVWNLEGVPYVRIFRMFSSVGAVTAITVLPGDKIAAAGIVGGYRAIKILDLTKQKENIVTLMPGDGKVKVINIIGNIKSLAVLKNGNIAMCDESDDGVKVFDRESKQIYVLKAQGKLKSGKVRMIKVLSDGRLVSAAARGMIKIWEADGLKVTQISLPTVTSISELEEDKLVCGDSRGSVDILDLKHEIAFTIDAHTIDTDLVNSVNSVCKVSGNKFATACRDGSAKVWQIPKQKPFRKKEEVTRDNKEKTGHFTENPFTIRGNEFDIVLSEAKTSKVLDNTDSKEALLHDLIGHETKVWGISELPDGRIVTASEDHKIKIWNLKTKEVIEVQDLTDSAPFRSLAVLSDGRIVTGSEHGKVEVWDLESKKVRKLGVFGDSPVTAITVLSGSRVYASGKSEGRSVIAMIDLDEVDENVSVLTPGEGTGNDGNITGDIRSIAILVNNNIAICDGSKDGVKIFNIRDHGIWTLKGERSFEFGYIWSMKALSGGRLAVGEAGQVDIWDMGAEEFTHVYLPKLEDGKNGIIISISELEKDKLVCGDHSGHVHVLDLKTKTELTMIPYTSDGSSVNPVSVEKISDSRFATLHRDGPPRIWQVPKPKIDGPGKPAEPVKAEKTKKGKIFYENGSLNVDGVTYPVVNEDLVEKDEEKLLVDVDPLVEVERSMLLAWKNRKTATLIGPPGVGKTEMAADLAKRAGLPSYIFPMRKGIDLTDWLGKYYQDEYGNFVITSRPYKGKDGKLHYREHLLEFMAHGGVFIVDEGALGKDAERMLQWLALIAQGKRKIKITEHPSSEPVEIELSEHFHVVITTNPIGKTALRRPIPLEVLANSQVINVSGDFSKDDLIRILYPIIEKSEALKELYRDSERGLDYYIRKICENLIEDHWDIKMLIGKEIATGVESLKQDRYFISLRELKNYAKDYVRFYPHIKGKRLGCPEITSYTVGHMINYAFMFGKEDRETIKMRRNIHAAYEEAILDSEIEEHDEYIELAGVRIKKGRIMDEFHRVREEDIDWGESIETEEHALRALLLSMATERPVMMLNEAGSRDRVILEKLAAKMNYEMHVNACSPDQSV